jgi:hypothetical protein
MDEELRGNLTPLENRKNMVISDGLEHISLEKQTNSAVLSPQANYTD